MVYKYEIEMYEAEKYLKFQIPSAVLDHYPIRYCYFNYIINQLPLAKKMAACRFLLAFLVEKLKLTVFLISSTCFQLNFTFKKFHFATVSSIVIIIII